MEAVITWRFQNNWTVCVSATEYLLAVGVPESRETQLACPQCGGSMLNAVVCGDQAQAPTCVAQVWGPAAELLSAGVRSHRAGWEGTFQQTVPCLRVWLPHPTLYMGDESPRDWWLREMMSCVCVWKLQ